MKYKVGDKVRIKSREWYDANKDRFGTISESDIYYSFVEPMSKYLGMEAIITEVKGLSYSIDLDRNRHYWYDWMFEGLVSVEKPLISTDLIKDIAEVIKTHNLGISISENEGKLIIEPLKVEEDLPINTPCMVGNKTSEIWGLRYYAYKGKVFMNGFKSKDEEKMMKYDYIIPFDKFNPNNLEQSLKYNIVKNNQ